MMNIVESQNNFILHLSNEEMNALVSSINEVCQKFSDPAFLTIINYEKNDIIIFSNTIREKAFVSSSPVTEQAIHVSCTLRELNCLRNILAKMTCKIDKRETEQIVGIEIGHFEEMFRCFKSFDARHEQDIFVYQPQIHHKDIDREPDLAIKARKLCELYTNLYEVKLYLQKLSYGYGKVGIIVTLRTLVEPSEMTRKTCAKAISLNQLEKLVDYFDAALKDQDICNTSLSLDFEEIFQITISKDEDILDNPDVFIMEFIINFDKSSSNYLKLESLVTVSEIKKFSDSICDALQVLR